MENVFTLERILGNARQWRKYEQDEELAHTMEDAIEKIKHQIAQIRIEQRVQFKAYSAISETVSGSGMPTTPEEQEVSFQVGGVLWKGNRREGLWPHTEEPHQLSYNRSTTSHTADKTSLMDEEHAGRQCKEGDIVPIPHKRVEALRGVASGATKASGSQALLQLKALSLDETLEQLGSQAYMTAWMSAAVMDELLREKVEKQRVMLAGLQRSKEEIVELQKGIERDEHLEEDVINKWTAEVNAFLSRHGKWWTGWG